MNNEWLADYLEENIIKDIKESHRWVSSGNICGHWVSRLREGERMAAHEWNNLAAIIAGSSQILGKNYTPALSYCRLQVSGSAVLN